MKHLLITIAALVLVVGCGKSPKENIDFETIQSRIENGEKVTGLIEYPPPNSSELCIITGYRIENGKKIPFEFEDELTDDRELFLIEIAGFQSKNKHTLLTAFLMQILPIILILLSIIVFVAIALFFLIIFRKQRAKTGAELKK